MRIAWFLLLYTSTFGIPQDENLIILQKEIKVKGMTSIGKFECTYGNDNLRDTLFNYQAKSDAFKTINFIIPVEEFGCGNFLLNKDFQKTMMVDDYPICRVSVIQLFKRGSKYQSDIDVQMAGRLHHLKNIQFEKAHNALHGDISLSFEYLGLKAPSRFGGLIKVEEELNLEIILGF